MVRPFMTKRRVFIAIVDDDGPFGRALRRLLSASGLTTATYGSGREFLDSLGSLRPDCVILDLQMPDLSGLAVLQHLANAELYLPTIIITAHDEPEARAQCLAAGAIGFLRKPVEEADLLKLIAVAIGDSCADSRRSNGPTGVPD
jgi:FixJ family two-component response regulator